MTKNILINIDNSLTGVVELWATEPMANGTRQTAPVFIQTATYVNRTLTLSDLQETPANNSWHYILIIKPVEQGLCSTLGNAQYRFFLPTSVASTVNLTTLLSSYPAWEWAYSGTNYAWVGAPNNSDSVKLVNGVEVARNLAPDPKALNPALFRATGTLTAATVGGLPCTKVTANTATSMQIVIDKRYYSEVEGFKVGDKIYWEADVQVTANAGVIMVTQNFVGGSSTSSATVKSQTPADGWVRHSGVFTITAAPAGSYFNFRIHTGAAMPVGQGFYFTKLMLQKNTQESYFTGDS